MRAVLLVAVRAAAQQLEAETNASDEQFNSSMMRMLDIVRITSSSVCVKMLISSLRKVFLQQILM